MSSENLQQPGDATNEISIKDLLLSIFNNYLYLKSKWRPIMLWVLLGALFGLAYSILKKPIYKATTTFVLESGDNGSNLGQYAGLASMIGLDINTGGGIFQGNNILELYTSRTMIEKTLLSSVKIDGKNTLLVDRFASYNDLFEKWNKKKKLMNFKFHADVNKLPAAQIRLQDSLIGEIAQDIKNDYLFIQKPDKNNIIRVDVNAKDEMFAKAFNDQIVENVNDFYVQTKTRKSMINVNILQIKVDSVRKIMNSAIFNAAAVADATPNLNMTRQLQRNAPIQRSQFSAETNKAILGELVKNLELSKIGLLKETPLIQVVDYPKMPLLKSEPGKVVSAVVGSIVFGFLTIVILLLKKSILNIVSS